MLTLFTSHLSGQSGWIMVTSVSVYFCELTTLVFKLSWAFCTSIFHADEEGFLDLLDPDKSNYSLEFCFDWSDFLSLFLIAFSKERQEMEYIQKTSFGLTFGCFLRDHQFILILADAAILWFGISWVLWLQLALLSNLFLLLDLNVGSIPNSRILILSF